MKIGVMPSMGENSLGAEAPHGRTPRFRDIQEMAQVAEQVGFDSFWLADHLLYKFPDLGVNGAWEVFTFLSGIAATTSRIRVGSAGVMLPHYSALKVAEQFRVLEAIAPGRIDLGVGRAPGSDMRTAHALT